MAREDDDLRGRQPGETGALLRRGLLEAGFPAERIVDGVLCEEESVRKALDLARAGDLLVIFGDNLQRDWELIVGYKREEPAAEEKPRRRRPVLVESRLAS
jgi:cyanophycin synthetase